jgi:protein ImuB
VSHAPALVQLARDFSPRVETHGDRAVTLDINGLGSLLGDARTIGEELRRTAADRGLRVHIGIASTGIAAILLAQARAGLTIIPPGGEAKALAPLPLSALESYATHASTPLCSHAPAHPRPHALDIAHLHRWGLRTLGDLAAIPSCDLSQRLGQDGLLWQRWARGEDARPLVPAGVEERFEESLDLEWPIECLEPLSFVIARLCEPLCERLAQRDRGAVALHVKLALVTRQVYTRSLQLPAPMRDARVLRTLALLDLESHPPQAAIDRVTVGVDVTEGRVLQFGLFARALPVERLATLMARLGALMGSDRVGAPALVDSYRPGAFAMGQFEPSAKGDGNLFRESSLKKTPVPFCIRRFRSPIAARVTLEHGRPVRVLTDRRGFSGGTVERCDGPWRSSGDWWVKGYPHSPHSPWSCDEWDVVLSDGAAYRISQTLPNRSWSVDGMLD